MRMVTPTVPVYFFGNGMPYRPSTVFETVSQGQISDPIAFPPTAEIHGIRAFLATIIWPQGTTAGVIDVQGADRDSEESYASLGTITYPAMAYTSRLGLVINFMRMMVETLPAPNPQLMGRLMIR